jgi:hypothetical protein
MRQQLTEAALGCQSVVFPGASPEFDYIKRLAMSIGEQTGRTAWVRVEDGDVVVTYTSTTGSEAA